jgi:tetratricopeptide (TPR) repeat protein
MDDDISSHVLLLNCQAMSTLDKPKYALKLLQQAEEILERDNKSLNLENKPNLLAVTYNNLACYHKSIKQPNVSLNYLQKVLKIEIENFAEPLDLATTHLNLCAIFSSLGKHSKAISSCFSALKYLQGYENDNKTKDQVLNSLIAANYNLGVEHEILRKYEKSLKFYQTGFNLASENLGLQNPMTLKLKDSLQHIKTHSNSLNSFIQSRRELREQGKIASSSLGPTRSIKLKEYGLNHYKDQKLPSIVKPRNQSTDYEKEDQVHREDLLKKFSGGFRRFSNAIDRLKNLLS